MLRRLMQFGFRQPFFDAAGGGAGGGAGAGGEGAGGAVGAGGAGAGGGAAQPFATFQDEASFMARVKREGKAQLEATAKELGFESVEAMQTAAKAKKDADDKSKTDLEKEKAAREKAEADSKTALDKANQRLINAEIKIAAQTAGFVDPADAVALIDRTSLAIDDAGVVTGAKEAVEALAKAKPHLVGNGKPAGSPGGAGNGSRQTGDGEKDTEFATNLAKKRTEQDKSTSDHQKHYFK